MTDSPELLGCFIFKWIMEAITSNATRNDLLRMHCRRFCKAWWWSIFSQVSYFFLLRTRSRDLWFHMDRFRSHWTLKGFHLRTTSNLSCALLISRRLRGTSGHMSSRCWWESPIHNCWLWRHLRLMEASHQLFNEASRGLKILPFQHGTRKTI